MRADRPLAALLAIALGGPLGAPGALGAQVPTTTSRWQPELRLDGFGGDPWGAQLGAGLGVRLGYNARLAIAGGVGRSYRAADGAASGGSTSQASGRIEVLGRFVLDPFRESARGAYAAAGVVQRLEAGLRPRTRLTAVVGVEGRPRGGWAPSIELGFGGGARAGVVLRRALRDGR